MVCGAFHHGLFSGYAVEGGESDKGKSGQVQYCGRVSSDSRVGMERKSIGLMSGGGTKFFPGRGLPTVLQKHKVIPF